MKNSEDMSVKRGQTAFMRNRAYLKKNVNINVLM